MSAGEALAAMAAARARVIRFFGYSHGWRIIAAYRRIVLPEMEHALRGAGPYGYAAPSARLVANGRVLGFGGRACVTNMGGAGFNEAVIPSIPTFERGAGGTVWAAQTSNPAHGTSMWYGDPFQARGAHALGDLGDPYSQHTEVAGRTTPYSEAELRPGVEYPEELVRYPNYNNVRMGTSVWRDFSCPTAHTGYYGAGLEAVGTSSESHRSASASIVPVDPARWWKDPDPNVRLADLSERQFSSGTPCVGDDHYDVVGGVNRTRRCFELLPVPPGTPQAQGDRFVGGRGSYSLPWVGAGTDGYPLEYSGDGVTDWGPPPDERPMRATSFRMIDGSELFALDYRSSFFNLNLGYRSLDVERLRIWSGYGGWSNPGRGSSWLVSGEEYEGVPPGWCGGGGCDSKRCADGLGASSSTRVRSPGTVRCCREEPAVARWPWTVASMSAASRPRGR